MTPNSVSAEPAAGQFDILRHAGPSEITARYNKHLPVIVGHAVTLRVHQALAIDYMNLCTSSEHFSYDLTTCKTLRRAAPEDNDNSSALIHMASKRVVEPNAAVIVRETGNDINDALPCDMIPNPQSLKD
jgi:hypothetical protein